MTQKKLIFNLLREHNECTVVTSLGTISYDTRELINSGEYVYEHYPVAGAMGCAIGLGLGLAMNQKRKVVVIIGDGSYNMKAGSVSTIMKYKPRNLLVYVIQNKKYASTGNQDISSINPLPPKSHFTICKVT